MKYKNPIISGFYPDPSICRNDKEEYFLVNSSFEYFPAIPLFKSTDLVNWEQIDHVLTRESQLDLERVRDFPVSQGVYAPTIRYYQGKYYVITTNNTTMKTFYVWTEDPFGEWSEPIYIDGLMGYDPSLYFEGETVYLTASAYPIPGAKEGIIQATIDLQTGKLTSELQHIWAGTGHSAPEGPHLYKKDHYYYLLVAEGGTEFGHMVTIARGTQPFGPFESCPQNPIASNRSTSLPIQATGHADMIESVAGEWVAVILGIRPLARHKIHHLGRETSLVPVTWTDDQWPILGDNGRVLVEHEISGAGEQMIETNWSDDFSSRQLHNRWNTIRQLEQSAWKFSAGLSLYGKAATLNNTDTAPVFIGCRQTSPICEVSVDFTFSPNNEGEEAGVTIYMNENFHYDVFRMNKDGRQVLSLRKQVGDICYLANSLDYSGENVTLIIQAKEDKYYWSVKEPSGKEHLLGEGEARLLSKEIAGGFTGVYLGMYATGNGKMSQTPAVFTHFSYDKK
ncbi:hypothetical protein BAU15_00060 [Enterococcus sp. JM4C]|uniref:glycoside hydrolase family 43 protein n=1 Tax=Candidatus Enterococcus huntleyi TaxID=1857217 RepID=UPI00137B799B|nr:glycoside hydrolase family 43 protein [Enterococcus sp. JM4C]KAF1299075.1 hypothetical protein BAU15_00060 [Enterococcus sp. JM4C]